MKVGGKSAHDSFLINNRDFIGYPSCADLSCLAKNVGRGPDYYTSNYTGLSEIMIWAGAGSLL